MAVDVSRDVAVADLSAEAGGSKVNSSSGPLGPFVPQQGAGWTGVREGSIQQIRIAEACRDLQVGCDLEVISRRD